MAKLRLDSSVPSENTEELTDEEKAYEEVGFKKGNPLDDAFKRLIDPNDEELMDYYGKFV